MATTPEGKVKKEIKKVLQSKKIWFFCPVSNGMGVHGIPDFICCWNGLFVAIEAKAPGKINNVSELQAMQIERITEAGGLAFVVDRVSQLDRIFERSHHAK